MAIGTSIPFQWAQAGTPLTDAMGAFLATQEMMARRRERAENLRQQQEQIDLNRGELGQRAYQFEQQRQDQLAAAARQQQKEAGVVSAEAAEKGYFDPGSPNFNPAAGRAKLGAVGASADLVPTERQDSPMPNVLPGDGPDPRDELARTGGTLGMMLARAGYGVLPEDPNDPEAPRVGRVSTANEPIGNLMMAAIDAGRRQPQRAPDEVDAALADRRQFDLDNPQYQITGPMGPITAMDPQAPRLAGERFASVKREETANRLTQLAATFPEQPTELMPFAKSDVEAAVGMVRSGAIPVPKIENARDAMEFLADLRAKRQNAEVQATGRERAARMAAQRNMDVLGDRALKGRQQALSEFDRVTSSFGIKTGKASSGELKQFASSIDRAEEAVERFKKSGDVEALGAIKALRNKAIAMDQVGALTEGDVKRGDPVVANFFDRTLDSLQQVFSGPPTVASMRKIIVASRQALNSAYDRHRTAAGAASNHYQDVQRSGVLGLEGARAYASEYNSVFGGIPGVKPLSEQGIVAPDIAGGERRSVKSIEQRSSTETTVKGDVGTVEDLLRRSREVK